MLDDSNLSNTISKDTSAYPLSEIIKPKSDSISSRNPPLEEGLTVLLFVAKYDYSARTDRDLSIQRGDLLYIMNFDDEDWWLARAKHSGQEGYIPSNYVAECNCELDAEV